MIIISTRLAKALGLSVQENYISQIQFCSVLQLSSFQLPFPDAWYRNSTQSWFLPSKLLGWSLPQNLQHKKRHLKFRVNVALFLGDQSQHCPESLVEKTNKQNVSHVVVTRVPSTHFHCPSIPSSDSPIHNSLVLPNKPLMKVYERRHTILLTHKLTLSCVLLY